MNAWRTFMPHGHCMQWEPWLVALHVLSDLAIALAYFAIPIFIIYAVRRKRTLALTGILRLFAAFILLCGLTHLVRIYTMWVPAYWEEGYLKLITAVVSVATAFVMPSVARWISENPSRNELKNLYGHLEEKNRILENALEGIARLDATGRHVYANKAYCCLSGTEEPAGMDWREIIPTGDHAAVREALSKTSDGEVASVLTEVGREGVPVELTLMGDSSDGSYHVFLRNLSRVREKERELTESNRDLQMFVHAASHDLLEPLRMINSYLGLISRDYGDNFDDRGKEFMDFTLDASNRMDGLLRRLLEYSRVGRAGVERKKCDMGEVLDLAVQDLSLALKDSDVDLVRGPMPIVSGDPVLMRQLLQNLIANAIKFQEQGARPCVEVSGKKIGDEWEISVKDNGIGISPESMEQIFQPFQRIHHRTEYEGTGLGLAICQKIAESHGGYLLVESVEGEGSTFKIRIPVGDCD